MKQLTLLFFLLLTGTLSAQVEHWKFQYSIGDDHPMEAEIYAERGRLYMKVSAEGINSETFIDSSQQMALQLNNRSFSKEYTLYYLPGSDFPTEVVRIAPDGTEYTVVPSVLPERTAQVEGIDFEVLREKRKQSGLVLQKVRLIFPELQEEGDETVSEGWIVKGKMISSMTPYVFKNGDVAGMVESDISYGGFTVKTSLALFEEVKRMPEGLFSLDVPEGYEDGDREIAYDYGDEEHYNDEEFYDYELFERYVPTGKPEPETVTAEQWRFLSTSDYGLDVKTDLFVAPARYRVERDETYDEKVTVVDSSVYWQLELEDHGFSYYRLEPFYASKANTDSLEKPSYITEKESRPTTPEGEGFRLLGDTKNWNGLKLHHVALQTWDGDWAQGDGWLLLRELPGFEDEPLFLLRDGRTGTLIEYDFYLIGSMSKERPDSLKPDLPDVPGFVAPEIVEEEAELHLSPGNTNTELPDGTEDTEPPVVGYATSEWDYDWSEMRWDSSQEAFDRPMPDVYPYPDMYDTDAASEEDEGIYDDYWRYPQHYKRKLMVYGKTVVSGSLFSLTPPDDHYDMQVHPSE